MALTGTQVQAAYHKYNANADSQDDLQVGVLADYLECDRMGFCGELKRRLHRPDTEPKNLLHPNHSL